MAERLAMGDKVAYTGEDEPESGLVGIVREDEHRPLLGVQFWVERPNHLSGFFEHELKRVSP